MCDLYDSDEAQKIVQRIHLSTIVECESCLVILEFLFTADKK